MTLLHRPYPTPLPSHPAQRALLVPRIRVCTSREYRHHSQNGTRVRSEFTRDAAESEPVVILPVSCVAAQWRLETVAACKRPRDHQKQIGWIKRRGVPSTVFHRMIGVPGWRRDASGGEQLVVASFTAALCQNIEPPTETVVCSGRSSGGSGG